MDKKINVDILVARCKEWFTDPHHKILFFIFFFALAIRLKYAFISGMWVDEGRYAVIGRALLEHPLDYSSRMHGIVTAFPPVFPYLLFLSQLIFGAGDFGVRIVNPVLGVLSVLVIYLLGKEMFNKKTGLIAAALLSVSPLHWFFSERVLLETPLTFFFMLTVLLFYKGIEKKDNKALYLSGVSGVLAFLTKQPAFLLVPLFLVYLLYSRKLEWVKDKRIWTALLVAFIIISPWMLRNFSVCSSFSCESSHALEWFKSEGGGLDVVRDSMYYVKTMPSLLTTPVLIVFLFGLASIYYRRKKEEVLLLTWIVLVYALFSITAVKVPRYVIFALPALLLVTAIGLHDISRQVSGKNFSKGLVISLILLPLIYVSFSAGQSLIVNKAPGFLMLKDAGLYFEDMPSDTVIMTTSPQVISFYGGDKKTIGPGEKHEFEESLINNSIAYVVVDVYERTQSDWYMQYVQQQPYLEPEKTFTQNSQPVVGIFKVNHEKLNDFLNKSV